MNERGLYLPLTVPPAPRPARELHRIAGSMGAVRYVVCEPGRIQAEMYWIGMALVTAEVTTRPAFREVADTLDWGAIR